MDFLYIHEMKISNFAEAEALHNRWLEESEGRRTAVALTICRDRVQPDRYVAIVEFDSYEDAIVNSALPETQRLAAAYAALADEPQTFRNFDIIRRD